PAALAMAVAFRDGLPRAGMVAAGSVLAIFVGDRYLGRPDAVGELATAVVGGGTLGLLAAWWARRVVAEARRARRQVGRVELYLKDRRGTPVEMIARPTDLRETSEQVSARAEAIVQLDTLDEYLREMRDELRADEVIFWRWYDSRDALRPTAWSTPN